MSNESSSLQRRLERLFAILAASTLRRRTPGGTG
jgi:hypothetical protein